VGQKSSAGFRPKRQRPMFGVSTKRAKRPRNRRRGRSVGGQRHFDSGQWSSSVGRQPRLIHAGGLEALSARSAPSTFHDSQLPRRGDIQPTREHQAPRAALNLVKGLLKQGAAEKRFLGRCSAAVDSRGRRKHRDRRTSAPSAPDLPEEMAPAQGQPHACGAGPKVGGARFSFFCFLTQVH